MFADDHDLSTQGYVCGTIVPGGREEFLFSTHQSGIALFEVPSNPGTDAFEAQFIHGSYSEGLALGDIDNDGDNDVCAGDEGSVFWLENPAVGNNPAWTLHRIHSMSGILDRVAVGDFDGDGDCDMVYSDESGEGHLVVLFNPDDNPESSTWPQKKLDETGYGFLSLHAADFDANGDLDIVAGESDGDCAVRIWETKGNREFGSHLVHADGRAHQSHIGCLPVDLDNDGDLDLVSNSWYHDNLLMAWTNTTAAMPTFDRPSCCRSHHARARQPERMFLLSGRKVPAVCGRVGAVIPARYGRRGGVLPLFQFTGRR